MSGTPTVVVFGAAGFAATHLRHVRAMHESGEVVMAGVCDVRDLSEEALKLIPRQAVVTKDSAELFARVKPDIAVVATPPHAHLSVALAAATAGCHLLLEKPPVLDLAAFDQLTDRLRRSRVKCQVGFQSFGSAALPALQGVIEAGALGEIIGIGAAGAWVRRDGYYGRNSWAGRRRLPGQSVVDGSLTNPFAHAVASALLLTGNADSLPDRITVELHRARKIEADDTSCARIEFPDGPPVVAAATLCAEGQHDPYVLVHGTRGRARWHYRTDDLEVNGSRMPLGPPIDLLRNLVQHVRTRAPMVAPLSEVRAFTAFVEAVAAAPEPRPIPAEWFGVHGFGPDRRYVVYGIDRYVEEAADRLRLFSELGVPWANQGSEVTG